MNAVFFRLMRNIERGRVLSPEKVGRLPDFLPEAEVELLWERLGTGGFRERERVFADTKLRWVMQKIVHPGNRYSFLSSMFFPEIAKRLKTLTEDDERKQIIRELSNLTEKLVEPAEAVLSYLLIREDEELFGYFGNDPLELRTRIRGAGMDDRGGSLVEGLTFLTLPKEKRERVFRTIAVSGAELVTGRWGSLSLFNFAQYPLEMEAFAEYWNDPDKNVEKSLKALYGLANEWRGDGVAEERVDGLLWEAFLAKQKDEDKEMIIKIAGGRKFKLISGLRTAVAGDGLGRVRQEAKRRFGEEVKWKYCGLELIERRDHPLAHLYTRFGYEIEFQRNVWLQKKNWEMLPHIGFFNGAGEFSGGPVWESAPGPYRRPETAEAVFLSFVRLGIIDLYKYGGQTVHFNMELPFKDRSWILVRGLQATGWAFAPRFMDQEEMKKRHYLVDEGGATQGKQVMRLVVHHENDGSTRVEAKEFDLLTAEDFARFLRSGALLLSAFTAHERSGGFEDWETEDEERLAKVWEWYERRLYLGLAQLGLEGILEEYSGVRVASKFGKEIVGVLPDRWAHYEDVSQKRGAQIILGGRRYANMVSFARNLALNASREVNKVMQKALTEYRQGRDYLLRKGESVDDEELRMFFWRFPCGLDREASREERINKLKELAEVEFVR